MTSGPRPARPHLGLVVGITCLSLFVLVVVLLVGLAYDLVRLRGQVAHIRTDASSAEQTLTAVPVDRARVEQQVRRLQDDTAALRARTHSPAWRIGSAVPVLGGSLRAETSVALVADDVSRRALPLLADLVVDRRTFTRTGPLDVSPVSRRRAELEDVDARLMVDEQTLGRQDLSDPSVRKAFVLVNDRLHQLQEALSALTTVSRVGPAMTGERGDRRYLVVLQPPRRAGRPAASSGATSSSGYAEEPSPSCAPVRTTTCGPTGRRCRWTPGSRTCGGGCGHSSSGSPRTCLWTSLRSPACGPVCTNSSSACTSTERWPSRRRASDGYSG